MEGVTIPEQPEITLTAVKQELTVRILECNMGGFIVICQSGMAACTTFDEVLRTVEEAGVQLKSWDRPERMPAFMPNGREHVDEGGLRLKEAVHGLLALCTASVSALIAAAAVKIA